MQFKNDKFQAQKTLYRKKGWSTGRTHPYRTFCPYCTEDLVIRSGAGVCELCHKGFLFEGGTHMMEFPYAIAKYRDNASVKPANEGLYKEGVDEMKELAKEEETPEERLAFGDL